jgi:hypothetical protein
MNVDTAIIRDVDDRELVREFVDSKSASAFEELVQRNAGMVYSAARRQVTEPQLAEDVTQAVFLVLAQRASKIEGVVAGWLMGGYVQRLPERETHSRASGLPREAGGDDEIGRVAFGIGDQVGRLCAGCRWRDESAGARGLRSDRDAISAGFELQRCRRFSGDQ